MLVISAQEMGCTRITAVVNCKQKEVGACPAPQQYCLWGWRKTSAVPSSFPESPPGVPFSSQLRVNEVAGNIQDCHISWKEIQQQVVIRHSRFLNGTNYKMQEFNGERDRKELRSKTETSAKRNYMSVRQRRSEELAYISFRCYLLTAHINAFAQS